MLSKIFTSEKLGKRIKTVETETYCIIKSILNELFGYISNSIFLQEESHTCSNNSSKDKDGLVVIVLSGRGLILSITPQPFP